MQVNEFRVRPVNRFVLTHFHDDGQCSGVRTIGEFPNVDAANEVAAAMRLKNEQPAAGPVVYPLPPVDTVAEFVVVGNTFGDESTIVHYAYSVEEAAQRKKDCEAKFGGCFVVFSRGCGMPR